MMSVGVTGHRALTEIERRLGGGPITIVSALADRLAAERVLRRPGTMNPTSLGPDQGLVTYESFPGHT